jgi:quercetin dioxygenase-like cupin family protein
MPLAAAPSFAALGWAALRHLGSVTTSHGETRTTIQRDKDHETTLSTWPSGVRSEVHGHDASETWTYVVSGEVEEERWTKSDLGEWSYESRLLRAGERSHLPAGALHRVKAVSDASVMSVYSPAPSGANERVPWSLMPSLRAARWRAGVVDLDEE